MDRGINSYIINSRNTNYVIIIFDVLLFQNNDLCYLSELGKNLGCCMKYDVHFFLIVSYFINHNCIIIIYYRVDVRF